LEVKEFGSSDESGESTEEDEVIGGGGGESETEKLSRELVPMTR